MLDTAQTETLQALVDTIIPEDDFAGGWEAGVGIYLLSKLEGDLSLHLPLYRQWLGDLNGEAAAVTGRSFAELNLANRTLLLEAIEVGDIKSRWEVEPSTLFAMIVEHCTEGFYADPGNGGNRDGIAWKMVGFEVTA